MNNKVIFKGSENVQLLKKIERLRFDVWGRLINPEAAEARFSLDRFDHEGWHVVYFDNNQVISSGRLMIATDGTSIPDLCSLEPYINQMTFPIGVMNRLVVHWQHTNKGLGTRNMRDRVDLASTLSVRQLWSEEQNKGISLSSQLDFKEMGPSKDKSIAGDWRIMCKTL